MRVTKRRLSSSWAWGGLSCGLLAASAASAQSPDEPAQDAILQRERALYESRPVAAEASRPVAAGSETESVEILAARVHTARQRAAEQRRAVEATLPSTEGLSQTQLEIRAAEQNLSIYDSQIFRGEATSATESFRRLTIVTLADARRKELFRVWGDGVYHPEAFDVLSDYGRSMAELRRIRFLAKVKGLTPLAQQSDDLMRKASLAFAREMQRMSEEVRDNPSFTQLSRELRKANAPSPRR